MLIYRYSANTDDYLLRLIGNGKSRFNKIRKIDRFWIWSHSKRTHWNSKGGSFAKPTKKHFNRRKQPPQYICMYIDRKVPKLYCRETGFPAPNFDVSPKGGQITFRLLFLVNNIPLPGTRWYPGIKLLIRLLLYNQRNAPDPCTYSLFHLINTSMWYIYFA